MDTHTDVESRHKVWEMIKDIRVAQLVTHDADGRLHARPMVASQETFEGELWFFSWANSPKIAEIAFNPNVLLSYSEPKDQNYVSITGTARVVNDHAKIQSLWSEYLRTWFPKGKEDPNITLICVKVESAEYWDAPTSAFVHAYGYAKARLTGKTPHPGENKVVQFETA